VQVRKINWLAGCFGLSAIILLAPSVASTAEPDSTAIFSSYSSKSIDLAQTDTPPASPSFQASDLIIPARAGAGYNTSSGGYEGFGSFQGWIPLYQTPGKDLVYLIGRLLLDNDANLGGNVLFGYRVYQPTANRIYGAYLSYDNRDTGSNVFSQLGIGVETLGDIWDARLNAYIPLGDPRQTIRESVFTTGTQVSNLQFQNNFLLVSGTRFQQTIRDVEALVAGFDGELGARILRFSKGGDLRGYVGLYYLAAGDTSFGLRGRLEARPLDYLTLGLGVQHDGIFGTNVFASIALSFPGSRSRLPSSSVLARMGEDPVRVNAIAIDQQQEIKNTTTTFNTFLTNPATGQPYVFQHVTLGSTGGNGTVENPFGSVSPALNAARSDGNAIVYVQAGTNPGNPGFTIPDRVQVLSTGVTQPLAASLNGQLLPGFQIPLSGTGALPLVTGTVTMRTDTVLSGFTITSATGPGISFSTVNGVDIRDNVIRNTAGAGVAGNGFAIATLTRNQITATGAQGIVVQNGGALTVADSRINNTQSAGVAFTNVTTTEVRDTTIQTTGGAGILGNGGTRTNLIRNQITAAQDQGIYLQNVGTATVTDNSIANTRAGTGTIGNPITGDITIGSITIPNPGSIIPLPSGQGIAIATTAGDTTITRNTVTGTGTQGIVVLDARGNATITDNSVANTIGNDFTVNVPTIGNITVTTGQGIVASGMTGNLEVSRNTVNAVRGQGITVAGVTSGTTTVANNTVRNTTDQGVVVTGTSGTTTIANNQISDVTTRNINITNPTGIGPATLVLPTGQGLLLLNSIGTVNVTGNTIERVAGAQSPTPPAPDSGQGIAIANFAGQIDLNLTNNQLRTNFNDGILIGLAGRPSGTTTAATANIAITGNTIENNGGATPVRGDGIAIGLEQDAVVNNLLIENNIIRNNGDEGIDIRLGLQAIPVLNPTTARLTGTIRNNTISGNGQNGIQVQANGGTRASVAILSNDSSLNGQRGVWITTTNIPLIGNPQISADIRLNTLNTTGVNRGFEVSTTGAAGGSSGNQAICVNIVGNISNSPNNLIANNVTVPTNILTVVNLPGLFVNNSLVGLAIGGIPAPTNVLACP
jgi:trimeric autotransporter adhesin